MDIVQNIVIVTICNGIGVFLKYFVPMKNEKIPAVLAVVGGVLGAIACITGYLQGHHILECVAIGMLSGMSSTGVHQISKSIGG